MSGRGGQPERKRGKESCGGSKTTSFLLSFYLKLKEKNTYHFAMFPCSFFGMMSSMAPVSSSEG